MSQVGKEEIRRRIWNLLEERNLARFPKPVDGRIPNFAGAEEAAALLAGMDEWRNAAVIKSNPDSPQRPVRSNALEEGKILYMAVPRLRRERCFIEVDPRSVPSPAHAATIRGAFKYGREVSFEDMRQVDLVLVGSVAVDQRGGRVGKGGGYSDLEYALAREFGIIDESVPVVTTVHEVQVVLETLPMSDHDVPVDLVVTQKRVIRTETDYAKPKGIDWSILDEDRISKIPILQRLRTVETEDD